MKNSNFVFSQHIEKLTKTNLFKYGCETILVIAKWFSSTLMGEYAEEGNFKCETGFDIYDIYLGIRCLITIEVQFNRNSCAYA